VKRSDEKRGGSFRFHTLITVLLDFGPIFGVKGRGGKGLLCYAQLGRGDPEKSFELRGSGWETRQKTLKNPKKLGLPRGKETPQALVAGIMQRGHQGSVRRVHRMKSRGREIGWHGELKTWESGARREAEPKGQNYLMGE